jgi:Xaa-Pro aminopeptidase
MEVAGIDLVLATSRRNVAYLTDHHTEHWSWEHAILHMMEKEFDGWDYLLFGGFPRDPNKTTFLVEYAHRQDSIERHGTSADQFYGYWRKGRIPEVVGDGICLERDWTRTAEESAAQAIKDRGLAEATIGVEMARIPARVLARLQELLPRAHFVDAFDLLFDVRQVKTAEEVRRLRRAYGIATDVYRQIIKLLRPGLTPREILLKEMETIYRQEASFSFAHVFFGSGETDIAYTPPPERKIRAGDVGLLDLGVVHLGYGTDFARMAQVTPANSALTKAFPTVLEARRAVENQLRPGATARDVFMAGARCLENGGLCSSISTTGHGIGLGCHEKPFLTPYSDDLISVGQTVVIEIYCEIGGVGPVLLEEGGLIGPDGWTSFTDLPLDLIEVAGS